MSKPFLILLITVVVVAGLAGSMLTPVSAKSGQTVAAVPGNTVVQDPVGDVNPASLPPGALPQPWMDIKTAKITQLGRGLVEFSIALQEPVPAVPPHRMSYAWLLKLSVPTPPPPEPPDHVIVVRWDVPTQTWVAFLDQVVPIEEFRFSDETVRVRLPLEDLPQWGTDGGYWVASVRCVPPPMGPPLDTAPDLPGPPSPPGWAPWQPR